MIEAHFGDIRQIIIDEVSKAKHFIYVAVAWMTDLQLFQLLSSKILEDVAVKVVLVPDEINKTNGFDYNDFVEKGGQLFWNNHHHKFCVIDGKIVINGSYNWTYAAHNRLGRENIICIKGEDDLAERFSDEFKILIRQSLKHKSTYNPIYEIQEVEKQVFVEVEKIVVEKMFITRQNNLLLATHDKRLNWWRQLNKDTKLFFSLKYKFVSDIPTKQELIRLFEQTSIDFTSISVIDIKPILQLGNLQTAKFSKLTDKQRIEIKKGLEGIQILEDD